MTGGRKQPRAIPARALDLWDPIFDETRAGGDADAPSLPRGFVEALFWAGKQPRLVITLSESCQLNGKSPIKRVGKSFHRNRGPEVVISQSPGPKFHPLCCT
jgi:hypothetical protein